MSGDLRHSTAIAPWPSTSTSTVPATATAANRAHYNPLDVHPKPKKLPPWAPMSGWTFLQRVFLRDPGDRGVLAHELVHVAQQRRDGARFYRRYVFSRSWRVRYEAEAYAVDVARRRLTAERAARSLSGPLYLWPCSYEEALAAIRARLAGGPGGA